MAQAALRQLRNRGLAQIARAAGQAAMNVRSFLAAVRVELAFFVGCLNLHDRLSAKGEPMCFPIPLPERSAVLFGEGLYDPCLLLSRPDRVVGNDVRACPSHLIVITGANEGGKSTFLRSVGVAQLMMQSGMFVAAKSFGSSLSLALFTHFRREEDPWMRHGKLEEEFQRMSDIIEAASPGAMILLNESLGSTYEQEGSAIACQMVKALSEAGVRMLFVTHLYEFARRARKAVPDTLFLRAERDEKGERTFRLTAGEPLKTAFADDLYEDVFGESLTPPQGATS
jgi:DNA mismatch repair ATPase MutS